MHQTMSDHTNACDHIQTGDTAMFTKSTLAFAIVVALASGAVAATKRHHDTDVSRPNITMPATHPEDNRKGWFSDF